jgi:urease accessory protein
MLRPTTDGSRDDPRHYSARDLPPDFACFETPVEGCSAGSPGKVGLLELAFTPIAGATRLTHHFQQFPLQVLRPLYLDPRRSDMAFVYVLSHGGTVQGDRTRIDVTCAPGAAVHVTTQSAAKLYRMERNYATQLVYLTAHAGSVLEYLPDPIIPFRDSRFYVRTELTVSPDATVIMADTLLPGRVAYGEHHDYTAYVSHLEARSTDGRLCFADTLDFSARRGSPHSPARLGPHCILGTLYVATRRSPSRALSDRLQGRVTACEGVLGGASELPNGCGAWVRVLGDTSGEVAAALHAAWDEARLAVIGVPAPNRRKT